MKTNLKYVKMDETQYWKEDFLERIGTKKVTAVYIFDANRRVRCCEITPSYEMYLATNYTDNHLNDDDYEEFEDSWRPEGIGEVSYFHCYGIDEVAKDYADKEDFEYNDDDETEDGESFYSKMVDASIDFERYEMHLL